MKTGLMHPAIIFFENNAGKKIKYFFGDLGKDVEDRAAAGIKDDSGKFHYEYLEDKYSYFKNSVSSWKVKEEYFCPPGKDYILLRRVAPLRLYCSGKPCNDYPLFIFILNSYLNETYKLKDLESSTRELVSPQF